MLFAGIISADQEILSKPVEEKPCLPIDIAEPEGKALILPGTICKVYNPCMAKEGLSLVYDRDMIDARVATLATEITREYKNLNPILISVLKGSVIFFSDLIRRLDFGIELDFIRLASYGLHTKNQWRSKYYL